MGAIRDAITAIQNDNALTPAQRRRQIRRIRAQALRNSLPALPFTFTPGPLTITVESTRFDSVNDYLEVVLTATVTATGRQIVLNNPFRFVNPPIMIQDPAGTDLVRIMTFADGTTAQQTFREDALAALRSIIVDAVRAQAS